MLKLTVRIYSKNETDKIEKFMLIFKDSFHTKNELMRYVVSRGLDVLENEIEKQKEQRESLEIQKLVKELMKKVKNYQQDTMMNLKILQRLCSAMHEMLVYAEEDKAFVEEVEKGRFDELPKRLSELLKEFAKVFAKDIS